MSAVWPALIAAVIAAIGWFANDKLTSQREELRRRTEAQFRFVERQLEELYGPLSAELYEGRRTFSDLLESLGRDYVFPANDILSPLELKTWLFWAESDFLPRNERIKVLLMRKTHLIEGPTFPDSYVLFLDHCNSWAINHLRWKQQQVEYSWHSKVNWPEAFETEVLDTFHELKRRHADLLGKLASPTLSSPAVPVDDSARRATT
ncbi:hypothetical protein [Bradyrhizobium stylosanthis]|uniref:Uncharacterized protein n=1 Tax=Bradyrhizobium stylosanthis TaxID=1803665 RepID=A0A560DNB7_9BRAD|nr:hypothetical protein [Bradyrhizobium stylosanthis]TWA98613.1 hypothetical protein FBZ96_105291 [Bradyrhizobium stylosanthis]